MRQIHRRCSAATDLSFQDVASRESLVEEWRNIEHGYPVFGEDR
jgi:hypothetical protein